MSLLKAPKKRESLENVFLGKPYGRGCQIDTHHPKKLFKVKADLLRQHIVSLRELEAKIQWEQYK